MEKFIRMFINFKGVIRLIAFVAVIMFFVPSYAISCSGYDFNLSQANLAFGKTITVMGETDRTSFFIPFALALLIPIAIIVLSFLWKKENEKMMSLLSTIGGAVGFVMVIIMRIALSIYIAANSDEFYSMEAHFKFGAFFIALLYIGITAVSLLSMLKIIDADKCFFKEETIKKLAGSMSMQPNPQAPAQPQASVQPQAPAQPQAPVQPVDSQPAAPQPVQEAPAAEAQTAATVTPGVKYCSKCGNQLAADMMFCGKCGTKCE